MDEWIVGVLLHISCGLRIISVDLVKRYPLNKLCTIIVQHCKVMRPTMTKVLLLSAHCSQLIIIIIIKDMKF